MAETIHFRSHIWAKNTPGSWSTRQYAWHGMDWNTLRPYVETDDARDIVWKKSLSSNTFSVKNHRDTATLDIIIYYEESSGDLFRTRENPTSRKDYYKQSHWYLEQSARSWQHRFLSLAGHEWWIELGKIQPRNALILVFWSELQIHTLEKWKKYTYLNDVIILHTFHPFEIYPNDNIMFLGCVLKVKSYKEQFEKNCEKTKTRIHSMHWHYLRIRTDEPIDKKLNYFFKNRYTHG
jgi:hypothetical protein